MYFVNVYMYLYKPKLNIFAIGELTVVHVGIRSSAVFCSDKSEETCENLQKATKALERLQNGNGKFLSLAGKILALKTYVFSTVWNNAWLIDIKDSHFKSFIGKIERYLCLYKGTEIREKVSRSRDRGGLGSN